MSFERLSPLDRSFLEVETPTAHMHVGWAAVFERPRDRPAPGFEELRAHIEARLDRAPRYRQRLARVPFELGSPVWVDDDSFDAAHHVRRSELTDLGELVDHVMSRPLQRERPLWQVWIADRLADGRIGLVGKAHHCMVDGIAAVELASLLLDPTPDPEAASGAAWCPAPVPDRLSLLAAGARERLAEGAEIAALPVWLALSPRRALRLWSGGLRAVRALLDAGAPTSPRAGLNAPISPQRHLARERRPLDALRRAGRTFGATVNDVLLAAAAGAVRRHLERHGEPPSPVKTMVPVNLRDEGAGGLGNRISFVFVSLPCDEPDPLRRLRNVHLAMTARKEAGQPEGAEDFLSAVSHAPRPLQRAVSRAFASPWAFNLTVSNIPGPRQPVYMRGCELDAAYPVVPISDGHGVSIGMTTIKDDALFGVYADRATVPDADELAADLGRSVDELVALAEPATLAPRGDPAPV